MKKVLIPFTLERILSHLRVSYFKYFTIECASLLMGCTLIFKHVESQSNWCVTIVAITQNSLGFSFKLSNGHEFILSEKGKSETMDKYKILIWAPKDVSIDVNFS